MTADNTPDMDLVASALQENEENILQELMDEKENLIKKLDELQTLVDDELQIEADEDDEDGGAAPKKEEDESRIFIFFQSVLLNSNFLILKF